MDKYLIDLTTGEPPVAKKSLADVKLYEDYMSKDYTLVLGADTGEINFYVVVYCIELGQAVDVIELKLREEGQKIELTDMIQTLVWLCKDHTKLWNKAKNLFPEFQYGSMTLNTLQITLARIVGWNKTTSVKINSVRKAYQSEFPSIEGNRKRKRDNNKDNGVIFGKQFLTDDCKQKLIDMGIYDKHDPYDALIFAKYGTERILKVTSNKNQ